MVELVETSPVIWPVETNPVIEPVTWARLGDVARIERNSVAPKDITDGTTYVGLENIVTGGDFSSVGPVKNGELASQKFEFDAGHILYGKLRPYLAKIATPDFSGICSTDILPIRVGELMDKRFVTYFLRQNWVVHKVNGLSSGANLPRISPKALETIDIPVFPLAYQRRIAAILDKADHLRTQRREALAHLDALTGSIFNSMFGDPVANEMDWSKIPVSSLLSAIESGRSPVCLTRPAVDGEWGILKLGAISTQAWLPSQNKALSESEPDKRFEVEAGDVLFSRKNTPELVAAVCFVGYTPPQLLLPDLIFRLRIGATSMMTNTFLAAVLQNENQRGEIRALATGSARSMVNISKAKLMTVRIPVPPLELQQTFARRVAGVDRLKEQHRAQLAELDTLFASLQHRAFKGEL